MAEGNRQIYRVERCSHARPNLIAGYAEIFTSERHIIADASSNCLRLWVLKNEAHRTAGGNGRLPSDSERSELFALVVTEDSG